MIEATFGTVPIRADGLLTIACGHQVISITLFSPHMPHTVPEPHIPRSPGMPDRAVASRGVWQDHLPEEHLTISMEETAETEFPDRKAQKPVLIQVTERLH
jgi:hypothetical protein